MDAPASLTVVSIMWCMALVVLIMIRRRNVKSKLLLPPGPWPLPIIGNLHMLGTLPHRALHRIARKYGPIMSLRLGSIPAIVVSSPEAAELFLKTHDAVFASRYRIEAVEQMYGNNGFVFAPYGPCWRKLRRMCTEHVLSPVRVKSFAPMRREEVGRMVESIKEAAVGGQVVDLTVKVGEVIGDMSCRMILGCSTTDKYNLRPIAEETIFLAGAFSIADYIPILQPLDLQGFSKRLKAVRERIDGVLDEIINDGKRNACADSKRSPPSFVDILMSDCSMQLKNIKAVILELLVASFDSTAMAIDWTMSELIKNPRVMALLQAEIHAVLGPNRTSVEETDLPNMTYLEMVVKESLRLHPVAPLLIPRESTQDMEIMGYFIPKKTRIFVNAWAIGRDEQTWSQNVHQFYPERFILSNNPKGHDFRLLPFGSGRRGCPGSHIGMTTSQLVVAQLVHSFNWDLPDHDRKDLDMTEEFRGTIPRAKHLLLKPSCRIPPAI